MKIWGGWVGCLEAPRGNVFQGSRFPEFPPKGGCGETFPHRGSMGERGGAFPKVSPKRGTWRNVSPSRKHGGARGRIPHPRGCVPVKH